MSLVKGKNIKASSITTSKPKTLDNGAKLVYVNYNGGRFNVQTPWMDVPWDVSCYTEGPYPKYSCELSFRGMENSPDLQEFHQKFVDVEQKMIAEGVANGVSWFKLEKKKCTTDVVSSKFGPIIKVSKDKETGEPDGKWPSTMKLKIPYRDDKFGCKLYNKEGDQFLINQNKDGEVQDNVEDILVKNAKVRCIIQCVGLWIAHGTYMCQWQLDRAEVEVPDSAVSHAFLPDSDDEDNSFEPTNSGSGPKMLEDSDEEEEPDSTTNNVEVEEVELEEEEEVVENTEPVKAKKVIRKKKGN